LCFHAPIYTIDSISLDGLLVSHSKGLSAFHVA
jgi:hypothetical protein